MIIYDEIREWPMIGKETPDRATVISGLEHCTAWSGMSQCQPPVGPDCPYEDSVDCRLSLMMDALELLKQDAKEEDALRNGGFIKVDDDVKLDEWRPNDENCTCEN